MLTLTVIDESAIGPECYGLLSKCIQSGKLKLDFISTELEEVLEGFHKFVGCELSGLSKAFHEPDSLRILMVLFLECFEEDERLSSLLDDVERAMGRDIEDENFGSKNGYTQSRNGIALDGSFSYRHCIDGGGGSYYGAIRIDGLTLVFYSKSRTKMEGFRHSPYFVVPANKHVNDFLGLNSDESMQATSSKISAFIGYMDGTLAGLVDNGSNNTEASTLVH